MEKHDKHQPEQFEKTNKTNRESDKTRGDMGRVILDIDSYSAISTTKSVEELAAARQLWFLKHFDQIDHN